MKMQRVLVGAALALIATAAQAQTVNQKLTKVPGAVEAWCWTSWS